MKIPTRSTRLAALMVGLCLLVSIAAGRAVILGDSGPTEGEATMPTYDSEGRLLLPADFRQWIFVGSSLGLSYSAIGSGMKMFHHTLMEPTSYRHFSQTGEFREGTQFVLLLQSQGHGVSPQRGGSFAAELQAVEMAVKDTRRFDDGWAYFDFGGKRSSHEVASALASKSCYRCHVEHAAYDNVFVQFYPLLRQVAPEGTLENPPS